MATKYGYGIELYDAKLSKTHEQQLLELIQKDRDLLEDFEAYKEEHEGGCQNDIDFVISYADSYEDNNCSFGIFPLMKDIINALEFSSKGKPQWFDARNQQVFVNEYIPFNKDDVITRGEIEEILNRYFSDFLESKYKIDWLEVDDG